MNNKDTTEAIEAIKANINTAKELVEALVLLQEAAEPIVPDGVVSQPICEFYLSIKDTTVSIRYEAPDFLEEDVVIYIYDNLRKWAILKNRYGHTVDSSRLKKLEEENANLNSTIELLKAQLKAKEPVKFDPSDPSTWPKRTYFL